MIKFFLVSGLIFIFTKTSFSAPTQTPASVCDQCTNQALINDLAADYGVKNIATLEDALVEKLWKDKMSGNLVPVGVKEIDSAVSKASSEDLIKSVLNNYSQTQLFVLATKILTPGSNEIIENCYKTCADFDKEMIHLYEGREAYQMDTDIFKFAIESFNDYVVVEPDYADPEVSTERDVRITKNVGDGGAAKVTMQNLSVVESEGNTKISALVDGTTFKLGNQLYKFRLEDPNKPGVLSLHISKPDLIPYYSTTDHVSFSESFQIIFPPRFTPTSGHSPNI